MKVSFLKSFFIVVYRAGILTGYFLLWLHSCQEFWTTLAGVRGTPSTQMFQLKASTRVYQGKIEDII